MTVMKQELDTLTAFSKSTFLNGLNNNVARPLGKIDMSTNDYPNAKIHLSINSSTAMEVGGKIELYLLSSLNDSVWTDDINPSSSADASTKLNTAPLIATLDANSFYNGSTVKIMWVCSDLARLMGDLPPYWTMLIKNVSGSTFEASGSTASYQKLTYKGEA